MHELRGASQKPCGSDGICHLCVRLERWNRCLHRCVHRTLHHHLVRRGSHGTSATGLMVTQLRIEHDFTLQDFTVQKILFRCVLILLDFLIPGLCTNLCGNRSICNFLLRILLFCWSWIRLYSTSSHLRLRLVESWRRSMHLGWPPLCLLCMSMLVKISIWIHALNTFRYTECSRMLLGSIVHSNRLYDIVYVYITHTYWAQRNYWVVSRFVVSQDVRLRYMMPVHVNKIEIALLPSTWGNFSPCRPGLLLQMWPTRPTRTKHNLVSHKPSEGLLWAPLDGILESAKASLSEDWWSEISPGEHVSRKVSWHQKKIRKVLVLKKLYDFIWFPMLGVLVWACDCATFFSVKAPWALSSDENSLQREVGGVHKFQALVTSW